MVALGQPDCTVLRMLAILESATLIGIDVEEVPGPRSLRIVAKRPGGADLTAVHAFMVDANEKGDLPRAQRLLAAASENGVHTMVCSDSPWHM